MAVSQAQYQACVASLNTIAASAQASTIANSALTAAAQSANAPVYASQQANFAAQAAPCQALIAQYGTEQAAATGINPITGQPPPASFDVSTLMLIGGLGLAAYLLFGRGNAVAAAPATAGYGRHSRRRSRR